MVVKIRDVMLAFNVLKPEGHSEPDCDFAFLNVPKSEEQYFQVLARSFTNVL